VVILTSSYGADIGGFRLSKISVLPYSRYLHRHPYAQAKFLPSAIFMDWMEITVRGAQTDAHGSPITHRDALGLGSRVPMEVPWTRQHGYFESPRPPISTS